MKPNLKKYVLFLLVVLIGIGLDQWSKEYASDRLATQRPGYVDHPIVLTVDEDDAGETVEEYLAAEFSSNDADEIEQIAQYYTRTADGVPMGADEQVEPGQQLEVTNRKVVVIDGYWDFQYTENPGAAFGLLSDGEDTWRVPFFIIISLIAVGMILYILHGVRWEQQILVWGLSFIAAGAVGNFIDRIRFGYVVDFIVWKYTNDYRWPTFNIADALICVGVALMAIELIRDAFRGVADEESTPDDKPETAA
ncbi:MAG: signal peptidase II [Persicimonas sp.]